MDGNFFTILQGLHRHLHTCECTTQQGKSCDLCEAAFRAVAELEKVPSLLTMSEEIETSFFEGDEP